MCATEILGKVLIQMNIRDFAAIVASLSLPSQAMRIRSLPTLLPPFLAVMRNCRIPISGQCNAIWP